MSPLSISLLFAISTAANTFRFSLLPRSQPAAQTAAVVAPTDSRSDVYGQAASNLVAGTTLESTVQQILDMGGGSSVLYGLLLTTLKGLLSIYILFRRYYQIDTETDNLIYMSPCQGIPEQAEIPPAAQVPAGEQAAYPPAANLPAQAPQPAAPTGGSNANPLDLFPQGLPNMGANAGAGNLDFLRNSPQVCIVELWSK
ncbi:hypothetical protein DVH24_028340 [Malus domestica]|uniref:Uncharacterized protein n=1 Tax=Malus domestica TaxID=3750 RepID=A0A498HGL2_MALDO|nr:hypothetical protein DVH24_028340 [Malus domestica]